MDFSLSQKQQQSLLELARHTIAEKLNITSAAPECADPLFDTELGAFVTLHKNHALRGCIGTIVGIRPLRETIRQMALSAAFSDPRFPPLKASELDEVVLEISVLSPIESASIDEIVIGKHGLILSKGYRRGLLLPQVATENNWTKEEFISHTCIKAGLSPEAWREGDYTLEKFSAFVFGENDQ